MRQEQYQEFFGINNEALSKNPGFFWVSIIPSETLYGQPLKLAQTVIQNADGLILGRKGNQLGLQIFTDEDHGAVLWQNKVNHETSILMLTDGQDIIVSDPCFIPFSPKGTNIRIRDQMSNLEALKGQLSWILDFRYKIYKQYKELGTTLNFQCIRIEEIAQILKRKLNFAAIKGRRTYF